MSDTELHNFTKPEEILELKSLVAKIGKQLLIASDEFKEKYDQDMDISMPLTALGNAMVVVLNGCVNKEVESDVSVIKMEIDDFVITVDLKEKEKEDDDKE